LILPTFGTPVRRPTGADRTNAGAIVADEEVVVAGNLITSRSPDDLPAFNRELIAALDRQSYRRAAA
jgi:putative intracellular protease/amidase